MIRVRLLAAVLLVLAAACSGDVTAPKVPGTTQPAFETSTTDSTTILSDSTSITSSSDSTSTNSVDGGHGFGSGT